MQGFAILLGFHLLGKMLQAGLSLPLPANVVGLILFVACLFLKIIRLEWVERSAQFLLDHLLLFFTPFVVGTIVFLPLLSSQTVSVLLSLIVSSLLTLVLTGWVTQIFAGMGSQNRKEA